MSHWHRPYLPRLHHFPDFSALAAVALATVAWPSIATAHIHLTYPLSRTDDPLGEQKAQHCGTSNSDRNPDRVTTFAPGQTITVTWDETIDHNGHFRIAFNPDGDTFGIPPEMEVSTEGTDPLVLKDLIADGTSSAEITLPNIECDNCTLQFIQVMYDKPPYTTDEDSDDIYFNCADLRLTNTPGDPMTPAPGEANGGCRVGVGADNAGGVGGAMVIGAVAVVGVLAWRSRRRRPRCCDDAR